MTTQVFAKVHYGVLDIPGFFTKLHDFIGHFQLQQSIEESWTKTFQIWFWTDKVDIKEGELRQVDIECLRKEDGSLEFKINKF